MKRPQTTAPPKEFQEQVSRLWGIIEHDGETVTAATTAFKQLTLADATAGAFTVTIPPAGAGLGRIRRVVKIDASANAVTVAPSTGDAFGPAGNITLAAQWNVCEVESDGNVTWIRMF